MQNVSLFGAGGELKKFIAIVFCLDLTVEMVVDNNEDKWGKIELGYVIEKPEQLYGIDTKIIISSTYREQIYSQLVEMGLGERIISIEDIIKNKSVSQVDYASLPSIIFDTILGVGWGGMEMWSYRIGRALANREYKVSIYGEINQKKQDSVYEELINRFDVWNTGYQIAVQILYDSLKSKLPFVLIDNWTEHLFIAAWILKLQYPGKVKILSIIHNDEESLYRVKKLWEVSFDNILAVSRKIENHLIHNFHFSPNRVIFRPNFLHYKVSMGNRRTENFGSIQIGWGARIEEKQKRADLLIPFIKELEKNKIDYLLNIAGDGTYKETLVTWVKDNGLEDKVLFKGSVDAEKMRDFWRYQDIYISLSDYEGFSLAMIEAMANGAVPIVTRVSGTEDFIQDGITGYLTNVNSPEETAAKVLMLYNDRKLVNDISINAKKVVDEKCGFNEYVGFIDNCLQRYEEKLVCP